MLFNLAGLWHVQWSTNYYKIEMVDPGSHIHGIEGFGGRKFEYALKHGARHSLFVVTLGWFVDSVRKNGKLA
ncbi:hypothetical protein L6164_020922 [Bauhinia variegata]|uniref:Uncharacterized protein n=1 Tax=Bauhinia variegata TaxID=167791 RepID=A0ACB9MWV7_BAUVA|nr:hypothetical protein L6164_020922 [Bauhinia variegata]